MRFSFLLKISELILLVLVTPLLLTGGESLTTWGYVYIGDTGADTSNGLYLRNYIVTRSNEVQYLHQNASIYFVDINDTTKAWISDAGNFPTAESKGDPDIALIDWEDNPGTIDHTGYYGVVNDTIWDPAVHSVQQFNDCVLRTIPVPDTISAVTQVELIWNKPIEDPGIPLETNVIGYNVYRGHDGIVFPVLLNMGIVTDTFYTDNTASIGDSVYYYAIKLIYRGTPDTIESQNFSANSPMIKANADIGILVIDSPSDSIDPDSIEPVISIINTGGATSYNFYIRCRIDSTIMVYSESLLVDSLLPDSSLSLTFPYWHPGAGGNSYVVNALNLLSGDANPMNDTLSKTVIIYLHDVGVDSLLSPADTIDVGTPMNPSIVVKNYGNTGEGFPVLCQIDTSGVNIYSESVIVDTLKSDSVKTVSFPSWTPPGAGFYTFYFITQLSNDVEPTNDTLIFTTYATGIEEASNYQLSISNYQLSVSPNPFKDKTEIKWTLGTGHSALGENPITNDQCPMTISIYDLSGRLIKSFSLTTGHLALVTAVSWDGRDEKGKEVPSGLYFCTLETGKKRITKNIIKLK